MYISSSIRLVDSSSLAFVLPFSFVCFFVSESSRNARSPRVASACCLPAACGQWHSSIRATVATGEHTRTQHAHRAPQCCTPLLVLPLIRCSLRLFHSCHCRHSRIHADSLVRTVIEREHRRALLQWFRVQVNVPATPCHPSPTPRRSPPPRRRSMITRPLLLPRCSDWLPWSNR